jgi:hypothetical protein
MLETSRGILLFAQNNNIINYLGLAILAAKCAKNNLGESTKVSVVTTKKSLNWDKNSKLMEGVFDKVILTDDVESKNVRLFRDTQYHTVTSQFLNENRFSAYELSPYDETLLVDVDYLILSNNINKVWGSSEEFLINNSAISLMHQELKGNEFRLNPFGIRMYWATKIYFKKGPKAKLIFDLVEHVRDCWDYYQHVYDFPGTLFRNDFAFSIAIHMLNGYSDAGGFVESFPDEQILTSVDTDQFIEFVDKSSVKIFANDPEHTYKFYVSKIKNVDVHVMNKISIANKLEECLKRVSQ